MEKSIGQRSTSDPDLLTGLLGAAEVHTMNSDVAVIDSCPSHGDLASSPFLLDVLHPLTGFLGSEDIGL